MSDEPPPLTGPEAQIRRLYADLLQAGQAADEARTSVAIATLSNGLSALCLALHEMAAAQYGGSVPRSVELMIGHAHTAATVAARVTLGSLDLGKADGE